VPEEVEVPGVDDGTAIKVATVFVIPPSTRINLPSIGAYIARDQCAGEIEGAIAAYVHTAAFAGGGITCDGAVGDGKGGTVIYIHAAALARGGIARDNAVFEGDGAAIIYVRAAAVISGIT